jgi:hypothetical protein
MKVTFHPTASVEVQEVTDWYDTQHPGLGAEFVAALAAAMQDLRDHPMRWPIHHGMLRSMLLRRFPYRIYTASMPSAS